MPRVCVIHWKAAESSVLVDAVRAAGFEPEYDPAHTASDIARALKQNPPDAVVIDLTRLPSHGREMAVWIRNRKSSRALPIVFVDGEPDKIARVKEVLPDATYTSRAALGRALKAACKKRVSSPVVPPSPMERFKAKTAAQKLGIAPASTVAVIDPPRDYASVLGAMPDNVVFLEDTDTVQKITLWFIRDAESMIAAVRRMRAIASATKLWILWPKAQPNRFREGSIRELGIEHGLVDYKICSVNDQWSGILFARKKA